MVEPTKAKTLELMAKNPSIYSVENVYDIVNIFVRNELLINITDLKIVISNIPFDQEKIHLIINAFNKQLLILTKKIDALSSSDDPVFPKYAQLYENYTVASQELLNVIKHEHGE